MVIFEVVLQLVSHHLYLNCSLPNPPQLLWYYYLFIQNLCRQSPTMSLNTELQLEKSQVDKPACPCSQDIKLGIQTTYDTIATRYLAWTKPSYSTRLHYLQKLAPCLSATLSESEDIYVLELGCGAGVPATQFLTAQPNVHVTANDISSTQLALAAQNLPSDKVIFVQGDMMTLDFPPDSFSAVVATYSLIHLPRDEQATILHRISRWLKPGGWLLANFGAKENGGSTKSEWLGERVEGGCMFWSTWGSERTCEILEEKGFRIKIKDVVNEAEKEGRVDEVLFMWVVAERVNGIAS